MALEFRGRIDWSLDRDAEGYREYKVTWLIKTTDSADGPAVILQCPGLPLPGSVWSSLFLGNDFDPWVWCRQNAAVRRHQPLPQEPDFFWTVEQIFANRPLPANLQRCNDTPIENPLLEPQKVSGGLINYQEEATHDRFGRAITSSSWEQMRGAQVEFDAGRDKVRIEQNVAVLDLALVSAMKHTVNISPLWGFPARCVKLSDFTWERKFQGQCQVYYTRVFEFETNINTFDRNLLDEGTKAIHGHWDLPTGEWFLDAIDEDGNDPNPNNPSHFSQYKDRNGENTRVVLNGAGYPAGAITSRSQKYLAVANVTAGDKLTDTTKWYPVAANITTVIADLPAWRFDGIYAWGNVVRHPHQPNPHPHLCIHPSPVALEPTDVPAAAEFWVSFPLGLTDAGTYDDASNYNKGDIVTEVSTNRLGAGYIHVEKYNESNFLLLGIPTTF